MHVADASHPEMDQQLEAVEAILRDLKLDGIPRILALNKTDLVPDPSALAFAHPQAVFISAIHWLSLTPLVERIKSLL